jgi:hypothetical protein
VCNTLKLPINFPSISEAKIILLAVEELYFLRRYEEAIKLTQQALDGGIHDELRKNLEDYQYRCKQKNSQETSNH